MCAFDNVKLVLRMSQTKQIKNNRGIKMSQKTLVYFITLWPPKLSITTYSVQDVKNNESESKN